MDGVETVEVRIVWDPVWTMDRLSDVRPRRSSRMPLEELEPYRSVGSPRREEPDHGHHRDPRPATQPRASAR